MAEDKQYMTEGLRSARHWLRQAETSFGKERKLRGELDLLLAQAELQRVKEVQREGQWQYRYTLLRQAVSLTVAVGIAAAGIGGVYWWQQGQVDSVPPIKPPPVLTAVAPAAVPVASATTGSEVNPRPVAADMEPAGKASVVAPTAVGSSTEPKAELSPPKTAAGKAENLSSAEMQRLVRTAGKSLRAQ